MIRLQQHLLALAAVACLGTPAFAQEAPVRSITAEPKPAPNTVTTDTHTTGPRTGASGTGNANGTATILRTRPAPPGYSGGTVSPSSGTAQEPVGTGIIPGQSTSAGASSVGTPTTNPR